MARNAKRWFYARTGWWTAWIDGKRVPLAEGKKNKKAAEDRLKNLQYLARHNPHADDGEQTVASVIERYMAIRSKQIGEPGCARRVAPTRLPPDDSIIRDRSASSCGGAMQDRNTPRPQNSAAD